MSENILEEMRNEGKMIQQETSYVAGDNVFVYNAENANLIKEHAKRSGGVATEITEITTVITQYISSELINFYEKVYTLAFLLINLSFSSKNSANSYTINVIAESRNNYELSGSDMNGLIKGTDPELTFLVGSKIVFLIDAPGHPFYLKVKSGIGKKDQIENIENNGDTKGSISWVPENQANITISVVNKNMVGVINIR